MKIKYPTAKTFKEVGVAELFTYNEGNEAYTAMKICDVKLADGRIGNAVDVVDGDLLSFNNTDSVCALNGTFVVKEL